MDRSNDEDLEAVSGRGTFRMLVNSRVKQASGLVDPPIDCKVGGVWDLPQETRTRGNVMCGPGEAISSLVLLAILDDVALDALGSDSSCRALLLTARRDEVYVVMSPTHVAPPRSGRSCPQGSRVRSSWACECTRYPGNNSVESVGG